MHGTCLLAHMTAAKVVLHTCHAAKHLSSAHSFRNPTEAGELRTLIRRSRPARSASRFLRYKLSFLHPHLITTPRRSPTCPTTHHDFFHVAVLAEVQRLASVASRSSDTDSRANSLPEPHLLPFCQASRTRPQRPPYSDAETTPTNLSAEVAVKPHHALAPLLPFDLVADDLDLPLRHLRATQQFRPSSMVCEGRSGARRLTSSAP